MAQGYDPAKAAEVNRLIAQGQTPRDALAQAGITQEEFGNYDYDTTTSVLGPKNGPPSKEQPVAPASDPSQFPAYDDNGNLQPGFALNNETGEPFYRGFPSQDARDTPVNPAADPSQFPAYDDDGNLQPGFAINEETGDTYFRGLGPLTQQTAGFDPNFDEFGGLDAAIAAQRNVPSLNDPYYGLTPQQLQALGSADPTDPYIRARLGIPQLPGSTLVATPGFGTLKTGVPLIDTALGLVRGIAGGIGSVFTNFASSIGGLFGPRPTASAAAATTGSGFAALAAPVVTPPVKDTPLPTTADPSQFPAYDDDGNLQPGFDINEETGETYFRGFPSQDAQDTPVNPASDPSQFPAYDDDGNLQPGFAINEETGGTYYQGFERNTDQPLSVTADPSQFPAYDDDGNLQPGFAINEETGDTYYQGFERNFDEPFNPEEDPFEQSRFDAQEIYNSQEPFEFGAANINDPYYGLTPTQLQDLGGADPTDPYIRARLGIPQLPGSTLLATPGFGTIKTGIPLIDSALNFLGGLFGGRTPTPPTPAAPPVAPASDPSQFPAYDDDGNLQPGFAINEETGEPYYQGFERNTDQPVNPASDPSQFPAYDDDGNLQPGFAINEETGEPYFEGLEPPTGDEVQTLTPEEEAALFPDDEIPVPEDLGPPDDTTTLTEEETANLFDSEGYAPVEETDQGPPTEAPRLLTDEELDAIYPPTDPQEKGAIFGTRIITDEARAAMSDPEAIKAQLAANAAPPPPAIISEIVELSEEETAALFAEEEASVVEETEATDVDPADDPALQLQEDEFGALEEPTDVDAEDGGLPLPPGAEPDEVQNEEAFDLNPDEDQSLQLPPGAEPDEVQNEEAFDLNPDEDQSLQLPPGAEDEEVQNEEPFALNPNDDEGLPQDGEGETPNGEQDPDAVAAASQNATIAKAQEQATLQARYKQPGVTDWRVRLVLGEESDYLYNADDADILKPLAGSNGVIFPYTPNITTSYVANYEQYNLIHSNYRGLFYKSSNVGDVQIRGTFTAQDTQEAQYLLAVIHFFRSVTKMFYGKDAQRGTPPPLVYLVGYGDWQFSGHPCVVGSFNYNLPNEVDYIRASSPNNYGTNLFNRRTPVAANPGGINYSGAIRLANALLPQGALPQVPSPGPLPQAVANTNRASYVPTKMEIDITLIPVQTREQVSKQFSLKAFANGNLLKGGYW